MNLNFEGIQFPIDESILLPGEIDSVRLFPTGGVMRPGWVDLWRSFFEPGDTVLDIGANIGVMSIAFALLGGLVEAFEASPRHVARLRRICAPLRSIEIHAVAVANENANRIAMIDDCAGALLPQEVQFINYDDYSRSAAILEPRFVKMDIEGMESVALLGMEKLIHAVRPVWQIEYHPRISSFVPTENGGFDFAEFERAGYRIFDQDFNRVGAMTQSMNYFLLP